MLELVLVPLLLAAFFSGLFFIAKVDQFIFSDRHSPHLENKRGLLRIGAESPMLFDSVASAVESCVKEERHTEFSLLSGKAERLLDMLSNESIDIALLNSDKDIKTAEHLNVIHIPRAKAKISVNSLGLPVKWLEETGELAVVWNRNAVSRCRDRLIFALENEHCSLKCGYADYLERACNVAVENSGELC